MAFLLFWIAVWIESCSQNPSNLYKRCSYFCFGIFSYFFIYKTKRGIIQSENKRIGIVGWILGAILATILGAYAGFLGAGVATFYTYGLIFIFNQSFLESTGTRKIPGLIQAIGGTIVFLINKKVDLLICLSLFFWYVHWFRNRHSLRNQIWQQIHQNLVNNYYDYSAN